jgi:hypothetical protein
MKKLFPTENAFSKRATSSSIKGFNQSCGEPFRLGICL